MKRMKSKTHSQASNQAALLAMLAGGNSVWLPEFAGDHWHRKTEIAPRENATLCPRLEITQARICRDDVGDRRKQT